MRIAITVFGGRGQRRAEVMAESPQDAAEILNALAGEGRPTRRRGRRPGRPRRRRTVVRARGRRGRRPRMPAAEAAAGA